VGHSSAAPLIPLHAIRGGSEAQNPSKCSTANAAQERESTCKRRSSYNQILMELHGSDGAALSTQMCVPYALLVGRTSQQARE
jgi:hypothetical protein